MLWSEIRVDMDGFLEIGEKRIGVCWGDMWELYIVLLLELCWGCVYVLVGEW